MTNSIGSLSPGQIRSLNRLQELSRAIADNTTRLSTFKRINSAKDDPAGLVAVSVLQQELTAAEAASRNVTRASAIVSTADAAAGEIVSQLQEARTLILATAGGGLSSAEIAANQIEVDTIIRGIDSLTQTTFGGRRLLDGSSSFRTSGVNSSEIAEVVVLSKDTTADVSVSIEVTTQATQATNTYNGSISTDTTLTVQGPDGSAVISLTNGASASDVEAAFNAVSKLTGIDATVNGSEVDFNSAEYGSSAEINITVSQGTFSTTGGTSVSGTDAQATINGQALTGNGTKFNVNAGQTTLSITLDASANGTLDSFTVSGEGLQFAIGSDPSNTASIGMPNMNSARLGGMTGSLSSIGSGNTNDLIGGNSLTALRIVDEAIGEATLAQAVIGTFRKNTLDPASRMLSSQQLNLSSALSAVQDTNMALETALLTNNQLLRQTTLQALSISSLQNQDVLTLLQGVRRF